jgi:hypothetical protein
MYPHFQKMVAGMGAFVLPIVGLFAQSPIAATDSVQAENTAKTTVQHSLSLTNQLGFQYDARFRTPHPILDFYLSANITTERNSHTSTTFQGGVLLGNWHDFSLIGGISAGSGSSEEFFKSAIKGSNVAVGLPIGIRYQPEGKGLSVQAQYIPLLSIENGINLRGSAPLIQIGYNFGKRKPRTTLSEGGTESTTQKDSLPQGIQHSFGFEASPNLPVSLHYDARFRTKSTWLDWAAHGSFGMNLPRQLDYIRNDYNGATNLGVSALLGKRDLSFEIGIETYANYSSADWLIATTTSTTPTWNNYRNSNIGVAAFAGVRYQPVKGGMSCFINAGFAKDLYDDSYRNNFPPSAYLKVFDHFQLRTGVMYSFPTKPRR